MFRLNSHTSLYKKKNPSSFMFEQNHRPQSPQSKLERESLSHHQRVENSRDIHGRGPYNDILDFKTLSI